MFNRMRNLHLNAYHKFGKECVTLLWEWEDLVKKIADFGRHRRFTLRCLKIGIILASLKLKNNIRTPRSFEMIRWAERQLLNERIKYIKNTIYSCAIKRDTGINYLFIVLDRIIFQVC